MPMPGTCSWTSTARKGDGASWRRRRHRPSRSAGQAGGGACLRSARVRVRTSRPAMRPGRRPIFKKTAAYGHFGRNEPEFTWEKTDKAAALRRDAGL